MSEAAAAKAATSLVGDAAKPDEGAPEPKPADDKVEPKPDDKPGDEPKDSPKPDVDDSGDDDKSSDAAKTGPPETYELAAPEGVTLDEHLVAVVTPLFKEKGWSNDVANQAVEIFTKVQQAQAAAFEEMVQEDDAALRKELGDQYEPTQKRVKTVFDAYRAQAGDEAVNKLAEIVDAKHGLGSESIFVRFLDWIAKGLKTEDTSRTGPGAGKGGPSEDSEMERLRKKFPTMFNEDGSPKW